MSVIRCDNFFGTFIHTDFWHGVGLIAGLMVFGTFIFSLVRQFFATKKLLRSLVLVAPSVAPARLLALIAKMQIKNIRIFASGKPECFCAGFLKPQIYISTAAAGALSDNELAAVLAHEQYHQQAKHPLTGALVHAVASALWFLPIVRDFEKRWLAAKEVAADAAAQNGRDGKISLVSALVKLSSHLAAPAAVSGFAEHSIIDIRITVLEGQGLKFAPLALTKIIVSVMVLAVLFTAFIPRTQAQTISVAPCLPHSVGAPIDILNPVHKIPYHL